jgi:hypothetical protein
MQPALSSETLVGINPVTWRHQAGWCSSNALYCVAKSSVRISSQHICFGQHVHINAATQLRLWHFRSFPHFSQFTAMIVPNLAFIIHILHQISPQRPVYGLNGPGFESLPAKSFISPPERPDRPWGPRKLLFNWYGGSSTGVRWPGHDVGHSLPPSAQTKQWSYTPTPSLCLHGVERNVSKYYQRGWDWWDMGWITKVDTNF